MMIDRPPGIHTLPLFIGRSRESSLRCRFLRRAAVQPLHVPAPCPSISGMAGGDGVQGSLP